MENKTSDKLDSKKSARSSNASTRSRPLSWRLRALLNQRKRIRQTR
ncbi:MAG: hypothetical protein ACR2QU_07035 [Gammaproteobacteria bacterium]